MNEEKLLFYREQQKFSPLLRWFVYISMVLAAVLSIKSVWEMSSGRGSLNMQDILLPILVGVGIPIAIAVLFLYLKFETEVRADGLYVRYFPFHVRFKKISVDGLSECYTRQYKPIREYGGWGIRCGIFRKGKAYNVSGNKGVQLIFKDGGRLLIGSQRAEKLEEAIRAIMKSK